MGHARNALIKDKGEHSRMGSVAKTVLYASLVCSLDEPCTLIYRFVLLRQNMNANSINIKI